MAYKNQEDQKEAAKAHYQKYKKLYLDRNKIKKQERKAALFALKNNAECMDCKRRYPSCVMDYDHRDPTTKSKSVSAIAGNGSMKLMLIEIEKCDLVCANCHRIRTHIPG